MLDVEDEVEVEVVEVVSVVDVVDVVAIMNSKTNN